VYGQRISVMAEMTVMKANIAKKAAESQLIV
jgi:hypothetical protein